MLIIKPTNKNRTKLINSPNDNESVKIELDIRFIGLPILYSWGDPELGEKGGWAITIGYWPSIIYYDSLSYWNKRKKYYQKR